MAVNGMEQKQRPRPLSVGFTNTIRSLEDRRDALMYWLPGDAHRLEKRKIHPEAFGCDIYDVVEPDPTLGGRVTRFLGQFPDAKQIYPLSYYSFCDPESFGCPSDPRMIGRFRKMTYCALAIPEIAAQIGVSELYERLCASELLQLDYKRWYDTTVKTLEKDYDRRGIVSNNVRYAENDESGYVTRGWHFVVLEQKGRKRQLPVIECLERYDREVGLTGHLTSEQLKVVEARRERSLELRRRAFAATLDYESSYETGGGVSR